MYIIPIAQIILKGKVHLILESLDVDMCIVDN